MTTHAFGVPVVLSRPAKNKQSGVVEFFSIEFRSAEVLVLRTWTETLGEHSLVEEVVKTFSDRGLPGAKTFKASNVLANNEFHRLIGLRQKQGFVQSHNSDSIADCLINFDVPLPAYVRTPKPIESISTKELSDLCERQSARFTVKYDGIGMVIVHHSFGWEFYSLSGNCLTEKFPLHRKWFEASDFKVGTIIKAEAVLFTGVTPWSIDFTSMNGRFSLATSTETTRRMIAERICPEPCFVLYDILFKDGLALSQSTFDERRAMLGELPSACFGSDIVALAELVELSPSTWGQAQEAMGIEGFVVCDGMATIGDKLISFASDPGRPKGHYKLKPYPSEDVVAYAARVVEGVPELVFIKQRYPTNYDSGVAHPNAGEWFACGRVSLHRSPQLIERINDLISQGIVVAVPSNREGEALEVSNDSGVTVVINFESRLPSGKFRHSVFSKPYRFRNDPSSADFKSPTECVANGLIEPPIV